MGNEKEPEVRVGYLELSEAERKQVVMDRDAIKSVLVSGFRDDIDQAVAAARETWEKETDPRTRPGSMASTPLADTVEIDFQRFGGMKRAVVDRSSGQVVRWADTGTTTGGELLPGQAHGVAKGGWLPPIHLSSDERETIAKEFAGFVTDRAANGNADEKSTFSVLKFPRGDIDNFAVTRWAMASERARNTNEGNLAYSKYARWETAYYDALERYALNKGEAWLKAQGDMVSGQDGGFLAPELWSTQFIDQIYPSLVLGQLPLTRVPMGNRVVHVPRLSSNISIAYSAENASLTAVQAQFQQVSFTARKQFAFIQISNELIRDSNPAAERILQNNATRYMAIDQDIQILTGNGQAGAPTGLTGQTNVTTGTIAGSHLAMADLITGIYNVENLNGSTNVPAGQTNCTGVVGPVAVKRDIHGFADTTNRSLWSYGFNEMNGAVPPADWLGGGKWLWTNILRAAEGSQKLFFGDWQHVWVMERNDIEMLASNVAGTAFANDQTWVRLIRRYDIGVAHPEAFYVYTNVTN